MARIDGTTLTFMPLRRSPASIRAAVAVLSAMLFTAVAAPGPAAASPCTLGGDLAAARDRPPSPCSHFALGNGARTLGPIAAGPGDGVTVAVAQGASQFVERVAGGGGVSRIPLPGAVATVYGLARARDGSHWFTAGAFVGRLSTSGALRLLSLPRSLRADGPVTGAADGRLWFADRRHRRIGRIGAGGRALGFGIPGWPMGIARGPDRTTVWLTMRRWN